MNENYDVDLSGGVINALGPASAVIGDWVLFKDQKGVAAANNLTFQSNGLKVRGVIQDWIMDINHESLMLQYVSVAWGWDRK